MLVRMYMTNVSFVTEVCLYDCYMPKIYASFNC